MGDPYFLFTLGEPRSSWEADVVTGLRRSATDLADLGIRAGDTQVWQHTRTDGAEWLLAHVDLVRDRAVVRTLRVDVDAAGFRGGWSPASLNWDDGVSAEDAGVELSPPDGVDVPHRSTGAGEAIALGQAAGAWMVATIDRWAKRL